MSVSSDQMSERCQEGMAMAEEIPENMRVRLVIRFESRKEGAYLLCGSPASRAVSL